MVQHSPGNLKKKKNVGIHGLEFIADSSPGPLTVSHARANQLQTIAQSLSVGCWHREEGDKINMHICMHAYDSEEMQKRKGRDCAVTRPHWKVLSLLLCLSGK